MKKIISISMVVAILFAFNACSSKEYIDIPVTDQDGQAVTDENGDAVTERVLKDDTTASSDEENSTKSAVSDKNTAANNQGSSSKTGSTSNGSHKTTTKADSKKTTAKKETTKKQTTTKQTTTEKAKKRDVKVIVYIPYYNGTVAAENELKSTLTVSYRIKEGDNDWTAWKEVKGSPKDVELSKEDGSQKKEEFKIKDVTGFVEVKAEFENVENIKNNTGITKTINATEVIITPTTGIESIVPSPGNGWI